MANAPKIPARARAKQLLTIIEVKDKDRLTLIDEYSRGIMAPPYMPDNASDEYHLLAERCIGPWPVLLVGTPAQACYVDNFRPGRQLQGDDVNGGKRPETLPEWKHWQVSRLDSRQAAIYRAALTYGHTFTVTEKRGGKVQTKGLSPLRTAALFKDAANDETPLWALTILKRPAGEAPGEARMWDSTTEYRVSWKDLDFDKAVVTRVGTHGASSCPVTRFVASVDLEGRTTGVIEPVIPLIDRINQTIFDLLVAQTYASIKVRTISGMAPPMKMRYVEEEGGERVLVPVLDDQGKPVPEPIRNIGSRMLYAKDKDVKFDTLDETPLGGFIESVDMSIRHLSAITQTPPHHLLGQIANLSAEALQAAETSLSRKVAEFRASFGESWERVFRLAAELDNVVESIDDYEGEVIWRDVELRSLAQSADGLGKLADMLDIPKRGLWSRVPNVTSGELSRWEELRQADDYELQIAEALTRAGGQPLSRPVPSPAPATTPSVPATDQVP